MEMDDSEEDQEVTRRPRKRVKSDKNDEMLNLEPFANLLNTENGVYLGLWRHVEKKKFEFQLIDGKTFDIIGRMVPPAYESSSMSFSLSSGRLAMVSRKVLKVWDVRNGNETMKVPSANFSKGALTCISNLGTQIAIAGEEVVILDTNTMRQITLHEGKLAALAFSHDDEYVLACYGQYFHCWNAQSGAFIRSTDVGVDCYSGRNMVASAGSSHCAGTRCVWNYLTGEYFQLPPPINNYCRTVCFGTAPSNKLFSLYHASIRVWDIFEKELKFEFNTIQLDQIVYCSADDTILGAGRGGFDKTAFACYHADTGEPVEDRTKTVFLGGRVHQFYATQQMTVLL